MKKKKTRRKRLPLLVASVLSVGAVIEILVVRYYIKAFFAGNLKGMNYAHALSSVGFIIAVVALVSIIIIVRISDQMYNRDSLTQVANVDKSAAFAAKHLFTGSLTNFTAIFLNIVDMRYINNRLGKEAADSILYEYAQSIKRFLGKSSFIGRIGGDNFILYIRNDILDSALNYLPNITVNIDIDGKQNSIAVKSRGGIYAPTAKDNHGTVLFNASIALTVARTGTKGNYVWFEPEMVEAIMTEKKIVSDFDKAILDDDFEVLLQPKVEMLSRKVCGAEALVSWNKKDGNVVPEDFVSILEKYGKVSEIDFFSLKKTCEAIVNWKKKGMEPVRISVNFSRINLLNPNFAKQIIDVVDGYGVDPKYLEIEITETAATGDEAELKRFIEAMREKGIKVAADDFGVGYSTLAVIPKMDFDVIKLDKSFLVDVESKQQRAFVISIIKMLSSFDFEIVCEGVETEEQAALLEIAGCDVAQGYLFGKNMSISEFEKML